MKTDEKIAETLLRELKNMAQGNIFQMLITDKVSYEYNIAQYNNYIQKIREEACCINWISNQICQREGRFVALELYELARHNNLKNEYVKKFQKYYSSACDDVKNANEIINHQLKKYIYGI